MKSYNKKTFPLDKIRRYLEPGPIVLVSSAWYGKTNIMAMGWHMMLAFEPALFGSYIWNENHSFQMLKKSKQCVINLPTAALVDEVVGIGNCSGRDIDKFQKFGLTPEASDKVGAPRIQGVLCQLRMTCGREVDSQVWHFRLGSRPGACRHIAQSSRDAALHGGRLVHGVRQNR